MTAERRGPAQRQAPVGVGPRASYGRVCQSSLGFCREVEIDQVMRVERWRDGESDSYPRIGYQHDIDSSWACLALDARIFLAEPV